MRLNVMSVHLLKQSVAYKGSALFVLEKRKTEKCVPGEYTEMKKKNTLY